MKQGRTCRYGISLKRVWPMLSRLALLVVFLIVPPQTAKPCGISFPNRILVGGDEGVLWMPLTTFAIEIQRIKPPYKPNFKYNAAPNRIFWQQTAEIDQTDLAQALEATDLAQTEREQLLTRYRNFRGELAYYGCVTSGSGYFSGLYWISFSNRTCAINYENYPALDTLIIPEGIPLEFYLYLRGAILYYQNRWGEAREYWLKVLELPADQRRYHSTWAAFMIGKTLFESGPDQAMERFREVRELAQSGFKDSLGLAAETYIWEGKYEYDRGNYVASLERFMEAQAMGYEPETRRIEAAVKKIFQAGPETIAAAARSRSAREVVTAWVASHCPKLDWDPFWPYSEQWLNALENSRVRNLQTADLLALTAYRNGRMGLAQRWLDRNRRPTATGLWVRAKLRLRQGRLHEAKKFLVRASRRFPAEQRWVGSIDPNYPIEGLWDSTLFPLTRIFAEAGAINLAIGKYVEAFDYFLKACEPQGEWNGEYWVDSAYLAERVLTIRELKSYIDSHYPDPGMIVLLDDYAPGPRIHPDAFQRRSQRIRYILARRLTRVGRWKEARPYYPFKLRFRLDEYIAAIRRGHDSKLPLQERISAFWDAGEIARREGMELMGTEVEPDWTYAQGGTKYPTTIAARENPELSRIMRMTHSERRRLQINALNPDLRFHYRYTALDHYLSAIALMPDEDEETARKLCIAGTTVKLRNPQAADIFYKALVTRCGTTPLGREADRIRWFPNCGPADK